MLTFTSLVLLHRMHWIEVRHLLVVKFEVCKIFVQLSFQWDNLKDQVLYFCCNENSVFCLSCRKWQEWKWLDWHILTFHDETLIIVSVSQSFYLPETSMMQIDFRNTEESLVKVMLLFSIIWIQYWNHKMSCGISQVMMVVDMVEGKIDIKNLEILNYKIVVIRYVGLFWWYWATISYHMKFWLLQDESYDQWNFRQRIDDYQQSSNIDKHWSIGKQLINKLKSKILVIIMLSVVSQMGLIALFGAWNHLIALQKL